MKLAQSYALSTGLKLDIPNVYESYFPCPYENFIVIHSGGGSFDQNGNPVFTSKLYSYWQEVIDLIKPELDKQKIYIIQVGIDKDQAISGALDLRNKTNIHQTKYLLRKCLLFAGNDSVNAHLSGILDKKSVVLFGGTSVQCHSPYWYNKESIFLESHRNGNKPSYSFQENPKTIDFIKPELVANSILKLLNIDYKCPIETIYLGEQYNNPTIEIIPDSVVQPNFFSGVCNLRGDLFFNENNIFQQASLCPVAIVIKQPINLDILKQLKQNVKLISLNIDHFPDLINYIKKIRQIGIPFTLISDITDQDELNKRKLELYEFAVIIQQKKITKNSLEFATNLEYNKVRIKSKSILLSNAKIYISPAHWMQNKPCESLANLEGEVIDDCEFWTSYQRFWFINKNE